MIIHELEIAVRRGHSLVDRVRRPPRRTPDGRLGIDYLGLVYPIADGGIDLGGAWFYPREAPICLDPPEQPSFDSNPARFLDRSGYRPYLFLNGDEPALLSVVRHLQAAGFQPERWGPSFRQGEAGGAYDWYVRLARQDLERAPTDWELGQLLDRLLDPTRAEGRPPAAGLGVDEASLRQRLVELEKTIAAEVQARDAAEAALEETRQGMAVELSRAKDAAAFLRAALGKLQRLADESSVASSTFDSEQLERALSRAKAELEATLSDWVEAEEARQQMALETMTLRAKVAELEVRLQERGATAEGVRRPSRARAGLEELAAAMSVFAPSLSLLRDSAEFIATEVADRVDLYRKLRLLEHDRPGLKAKRVHAVDGWLEVHFSTGLARDGRLYFTRLDDGGTRWGVLVSDKAAQPRDFDWIRQQ